MDLEAFFSTFEGKDWVTALLSIAAILVSIWTLSQTWRYHPKPTLVGRKFVPVHNSRAEPDWQNSGPSLSFEIWNRGNGPAYDVVVSISTPRLKTPFRASISFAVLEESQCEKVHLSLSSPIGTEVNRYEYPVQIYSKDPIPAVGVKITVRWRQSPSMWLHRRKRIRIPTAVRENFIADQYQGN